MVSIEMVPFSKVGGLADVVGSLPKYLPEDTTVITPLYGKLTYDFYSKITGKELKPEFFKKLDILGREVEIYVTTYENVKVHLVYNRELFDREGIYLDSSGKPFEDEILRYYVFSSAAFEIAKEYDIIHCHDWHTSFVLYLAKKNGYQNTIFTIHNIAYQGIVDFEKLSFIDQDLRNFIFSYAEYYGKVNLMKGAIVLADIVSTVSKNYAFEIMNFNQFGMGLENILKANSSKVVGILNGIDYDLWDPSKDKHIYFNYSIDNVDQGKEINKERLLKDLNLERGRLLFGIVARLDHQKGFDILYDAYKLLGSDAKDINLVVLGSGNVEIQNSILKLQDEYKGYVSVNIRFDETLARRIYAASDYFLIPSRFEPCGLSQMISYRYGTIPIATRVGGLKDSIIDIFEDPSNGTGILIDYADKTLLSEALKKAINFDNLSELRKRVMKLDFSWEKSAKEYLEVFRRLLSKTTT